MPVPIKAPYSMSFVVQYHVPFHPINNIIKRKSPDNGIAEALQSAIKSITDSVGLDVLVPKHFVYGALPRPEVPSESLAPSTFERAVAVRKAT